MVLAGVGLRAHEEVSEEYLWRCLHGQQVEVAEHVQPVVPELAEARCARRPGNRMAISTSSTLHA